ncbi:hypothetical protein [Stenotrophomonas sp.]|uniref:hypothetical protein n=1 Tax=Stenotrophomonas sp. TaxID=69392 RepID=UPI00289E7E59|nr:hypothetical protein [Stenotrophomonas sp.]
MHTSTTNSRPAPGVDGLHRCVRLACGSALLSIAVPAWAACDITAPASLQTVKCTGAAPNPFTTAVTSTAGARGVTVQVSAGAQLAVSAGNAIFLQGGSGHTIVNDGSISSAAGTALFLNGATRVVNRGTISGATGGIVSGEGNDQLEMLGGTISGGVVQGAGDDAIVINGGNISSIDQGAGQDSLEISGGTVSGIV